MKKIILLLFFIIIFLILINSNVIINNVLFSFNLCFNNLFPSLIPFLLLSNIIIKFDLIDELTNIFSFITTNFFKINKHAAFALVMSMISGSPSNSKYLKDLKDNELINDYDIKKCLNFCHYINPIFIISTIGVTFLNNKKLGLIILISHFLSSFVIGIIFRNQKHSKIYNKAKNKINNYKFIDILNESIVNTAKTLLLILGVITVFLIITCLIDYVIKIDDNYKFIYGLLEITQGLKYLSISNLSISIKTIISSFLISFGGICIHIQVFSILDNKKIRYLPYLFSRLIHGLISSLITYIIMLFY